MWNRWICYTGVNEKNDTGKKKEKNGNDANERTGEKNEEKVKNETLKGSNSSGRMRTTGTK